MIQDIRIKNFMSFRDETFFSFEPTDDRSDEYVVQMPDSTKLLRFAVVFGANASGKTSFIKVFGFLEFFWHFVPSSKDDPIPYCFPFWLNDTSRNEPTEFEIHFYVNGIRYQYTLSICKGCVFSEELSLFNDNELVRVFLRSLKDDNLSVVEFNDNRSRLTNTEKDNIALSCLKNISLFAAFRKVNVSHPDIDKVVQWIDRQFMRAVASNTDLTYNLYSKLQFFEFKSHILSFTRQADFNIEDINVSPIQNTNNISNQLHADYVVRVSDNGTSNVYSLPDSLQSDGTKRALGLESVIFTALQNGAILAIDEFESSIHPLLLDHMLQEFIFKEDSESQLIISTHYDPLLAKVGEYISADSVWFVNKNSDGCSELYSLSDFEDLDKLTSIQKAYLSGRLRAVPNI